MAGPSGFMLFRTSDHGGLLRLAGQKKKAVQYLVGTPNLADELEEGLSRLGISLEDVEREHL